MRAFAELFLLVVGILYATGFLAAFTFLERFGVRESGTEFLKLKYIYVWDSIFLVSRNDRGSAGGTLESLA